MVNTVYLNRSLSYVDFNSYYDEDKNKFYLSFQFDVPRSLEIESDIVPSVKTHSISIINLTCTLTLISSKNIVSKEIIMKPDRRQLKINLATNLTFYRQVDQLELENLLEWRKGGDVTLKWSFYGNGLADINGHTILLTLSYDSTSGFISPHISQNKWDSIVRNYKLDDKFISEYYLSIPDNLRQKDNKFLNKTLSDLNTMILNLNNAKDRLRKASNASDYKAVMVDVKRSLDSIKNFEINPTVAKQFLVDSGTFSDRDVGGGEKASLEVTGRIRDIMEQIYKISSKAAHTELERGGLKFEMNPDREDALFVFESSLCILKYFVEKFKKVN